MNIILFYENKGDFAFCTNFYPQPFTEGDEKYLTSEHYYQVMKYRYKGASERSVEYSTIIQACDSPAKTKVLGHQKPHRFSANWKVNKDDSRKLNDILKEYSDIQMNPNWEKRKLRVMYRALCGKFSDETLKEKLVNVPDNTYFVEHTTRDKIWADGGDGGTGKIGTNYLGKLLTLLSHLYKYGNVDKISDELAERMELKNLLQQLKLRIS